ncbi:MAG: CpsD/CapB family tyrosine-protein kinase [Candidatus Latescibacterota bacterium]|nr:MAG: CpsD/CapB family tyrosine-protein kinase [Candidatus Latescibacterota bacterium]
MSKIFDAMKRAEDERRKRAARAPESSQPVETIEERPVIPPRVDRVGQLPGEFFRQLGMLRNAVDVALEGKTKRTILFASSMSGEGTTTIATNFAKVLALQGHERVLVCEMNARRPRFPDVFSINGTEGVTEYFADESDLPSYVHTTDSDDLGVLHVGKQDATIIQLHLNQVFPRLIEETMRHYDTMIIDAPPILNSPETAPMTAFVDAVVVVVQAGKTKREVVGRSMESIEKFDGNVLGVVLNRKKYYIPDFLYKRI